MEGYTMICINMSCIIYSNRERCRKIEKKNQKPRDEKRDEKKKKERKNIMATRAEQRSKQYKARTYRQEMRIQDGMARQLMPNHKEERKQIDMIYQCA